MPMRIAASPRAWMMKGDATWKAPSAAAPFMSVRRLKVAVKSGNVMRFPPEDFVSCLIFSKRPGVVKRQAAFCRGSSRPLDFAAGGLRGTGGFFARHRIAHRKHLVGIALGRMRLADEDGAHQFMIASAIFRRSRLQRNLRRQLEF